MDDRKPIQQRKGLFVVPKSTAAPMAKVVTYDASGQVVIQSEFSEHLETLTKSYIAEFQPKGVTELTLVRDMASLRCRCEYVSRLQIQPGIVGNQKMLETLTRYRATSEKAFKRSARMLKQIQKERMRDAAKKLRLIKP